MILGNVRQRLLQRLIDDLPRDARVAMCCAGRGLHELLPQMRAMLGGRQIVAVLDDAPAILAAGAVAGLPVQRIDSASRDDFDAIVITSAYAEDWVAGRLRSFAAAGGAVIRATNVPANDAVTPAMVESLIDDPLLSLEDRCAPWLAPLPEKPLWAGLEITTGCNLNCLMCETHSAQRPTGQIEMEMFQRALDELEYIGCRMLTYHTIGEPTIHRRFADLLRISAERGFAVWLSTNGMLLDRFFDALRQWPPAVIRWSVDGATQETYERIRAGGDFAKLLANMAATRRMIEQHGLPTRMELNATLSADNLHEAPLFYDVYGPYLDDARINFSVINSLSAGDRSYYAENRLFGDTPQVPCVPLWQSLYVGYDGQVSACCRDYHGDLIVGDLRTHTLEEIWRGPEMSSLRSRHEARDFAALPIACQNCHAAETGQTELLTSYVTALSRRAMKPSREEFARMLDRFVGRLRGLRPDRSAFANGRGLRLPVLASASV